jgi:GNAT superfamily N-acetyltransferase
MAIETRIYDAAALERDLERFAEILRDCVEGGASVNFLRPFSMEEARGYWRNRVGGVRSGEIILFGVLADGVLAGTVQLVPAMQPNGPHRADVSKMLVHRGFRRRGLGRVLLEAAEEHARSLGRNLLILDTAAESAGEKLYRQCGWQVFGTVPGFALNTDGFPEPAVFFMKTLP